MKWLFDWIKSLFKKKEAVVIPMPKVEEPLPPKEEPKAEEPKVEDPKPPVKEEPKPKAPYVYRTAWPKAEWTAMTVKALKELGKEMLAAKPKDRLDWHPDFDKFSEDQKIEFYAMLISALAKFESNYKPETSYKEAFKDAKGKNVISRGLLQLSIESSNGYGAGLKNAEELHDPETNIRVGVRIMNRWIPKDGCIVDLKSGKNLGAGRYWSPFRKEDRIAAMKVKTRSLK